VRGAGFTVARDSVTGESGGPPFSSGGDRCRQSGDRLRVSVDKGRTGVITGPVSPRRTGGLCQCFSSPTLSTRFLRNDSGDLVITGRACCVWSLRLAFSGFVSFFVGRSLVGDLHSVSSGQNVPSCRTSGSNRDLRASRAPGVGELMAAGPLTVFQRRSTTSLRSCRAFATT